MNLINTLTLDGVAVVAFPNRIRELRRSRGFHRLQALADAVPSIPYIRLSRLERGESFGRPAELRSIAAALSASPIALLPDQAAPPPITGNPATGESSAARKLGAAIRARRKGRWTVSALHREFGMPPVTLARLESGSRPLERWNDATRAALRRLFGVADDAALIALVDRMFASGGLAEALLALDNPDRKLARVSRRMAVLRRELGEDEPVHQKDDGLQTRLLAVVGSPLVGGLIAPIPVGGLTVEAPRHAGPNAFALRVCAPTLGPGLPAHAVVIADPDVPALPGGLAVLRIGHGYRILAFGFGRGGVVRGLTVSPHLDVPIDGLDPADLSAVIAVAFP